MQQVFVEGEITDGLVIAGEDGHHLSDVVRLKCGENLRVSDHVGNSFLCEVTSVSKGQISIKVLEELESTELPGSIILFQAVPKGERMETIIEKCVELGVDMIVPVTMQNCVVKLEEKKIPAKIKRWQAIADSAAKQCKRSVMPQVKEPVSLKEAIALSLDLGVEINIVPYECAEGMKATAEVLADMKADSKVAIYIGPEGGYSPLEVDMLAEAGGRVVSLGKRILRTDTAAIATVSMVMLKKEMEI